jgi:hypothetical protein
MHRMGFAAILVAAGLVSACGKKAPPQAATPEATEVPTGFVAIDISEEEEDDFFPELRAATAECGDLVTLEPSAMMGKLADPEIRCLDDALVDAERQTVKDKISRVLMADAWAKGDAHRWEGVARRHLDEIDRSDPDLCYKYSKYLSSKGPEHTDEAMRWADVALENRSRWTGDLHVKRVYSLFKLKTLAAQKQWTHLEEQFSVTPSDSLEKQKEEVRNMTKTLAREWLEYARSSGKDATLPMQICVSSSGTDGYCDEV